MEKTQENFSGRRKRFFIGIIFLISSSIIGWAAVFICGALAVKFGRRYVIAGSIIYALSWIPFGLGFFLAGSEGIKYAKGFFKRIFKR